MSLYDRNYTRDADIAVETSENTLVNFVKQTYKFFAASVLFATIGAYIGMGFVSYMTKGVFFGLVIVEFALLLGLIFLKSKPIVNVMLLFAFTFITGVTLVPLLASVLGLQGGASIVAQALLMTTIIFGVMSFFALKTTKDLANMGKILFVALVVIVIASLVNIFLGNPLLQVIIAAVGAIVFSLYIAYDTQNIIRGRYDSPIMAAISLYLDVLNLFISLLQLLSLNRE
ncbi:Bax inhibitor-1/YccA family protein [Helicobacter sp. MIT 99-5507]|uniref:Bax inhibitor-1/YccA family protein n=1 Tax=Helicobacter sp. MIT 99-5507 TaxID=152489 RepID=UPI000E1F6A55|nr:Bax inhibitor-1/YccA family protein [Helicobacter sp. MIT 99-5507]RDU57931.1 BAX inhibitor (BI)-1/YccA family protein [Helicobacter sp. MIT 99-5507]